MAGLLMAGGAQARSVALQQGIDVSHHQGRIDWQQLPRQGVTFAYIKASEGGSHRDRAFAANWAGAKAAGLQRGAYHYFTLCRAGADQAANFIAAVPVDSTALAPAVDLEFLGNCDRRPTPDAFHAELAAFLRAVEKHYGKPVLLYLTEEFDQAYAVSARVDRRLWLRSLGKPPGFGARPWSLWQQSHSRKLNGIATPVDWNVAR
ncbi:lysozyme [Sphingomonas laterariae]|uniref:Lysozyme n=2 Tax=Edaphosphingomonas laterariae TaxID=861865 RepID=A0A239E630_9SPHN|nr:lysozyme [Sphingomonas laterariae]